MSVDLKTAFGESKEDGEVAAVEQSWVSWDVREEASMDEQLPSLPAADPNAKESSAGFKFSFLGDEPESPAAKTGGLLQTLI